MATVTWQGGAAETSYAVTLTAVGVGTGTGTLGVAVGGQTVTAAVAGAMTGDTFAAALAASLQASTAPEVAEVTWTNTAGSPVVSGTGVTPGLTVTVAAAAGGTLPAALPFPFGQGPGDTAAGLSLAVTTTQATGPNDLANAANYDTGALPTGGDDLVFAAGAPPVYYGLTALSAVSLATVTAPAGYAGPVGLPAVRGAGTATVYPEYRSRYLTLGGNPAVTVGEGDGPGCGRFLLAAGTGTCTLTVLATASRLTGDVPAVNWTNTAGGGTNVLNVAGGDVGLAAEAGQTSAVGTLRTPQADAGTTPPLVPTGQTPAVTAPRVTVGAGGTVTTADVDGGRVDCHGTVTTLGMTGGVWAQWGGTATTITCDGGTVQCRQTGTVATLTFRSAAARFERPDPRPLTVTNHTFTGRAVCYDPNKSVTFSNGGTWDNASLQASTLGAGQFTILRT